MVLFNFGGVMSLTSCPPPPLWFCDSDFIMIFYLIHEISCLCTFCLNIVYSLAYSSFKDLLKSNSAMLSFAFQAGLTCLCFVLFQYFMLIFIIENPKFLFYYTVNICKPGDIFLKREGGRKVFQWLRVWWLCTNFIPTA